MGAFARAFRVAGLPVRMSQGFNPHPRFSLPAPLPVGAEGLDEPLELDLAEPMAPDELCVRLQAALPEGIRILSAEPAAATSHARVDSVTYRAHGELPAGALERARGSEPIPVERRDGRRLDVRPYLRRIAPCEGGCEFELAVTPEGSARPAEILGLLCAGEADRVNRLALTRTAVNLAPAAGAGPEAERDTG